MMQRGDVLDAVISTGGGNPIIFTTGYTCREAFAIRDSPNHLYMTGSMGMAAVIGAGVAQRSPVTTIVIDGDGAILMNPSALMVIAQYQPASLLHLVLDNCSYESTGGQPSASSMFDIPAMAVGMGYRQCSRISETADLYRVLPSLVRTPKGPHLMYIRTASGNLSGDRITIDPADNFTRFRSWITGCAREVQQ